MSNETQKTEESKNLLTTTDDGAFDLTTLQGKMAFAQVVMRQEMVSKTFKTPQQVVLGLEYSRCLDLEPLVGLKMMYVIDGKPCLYGDGPLTMVRRSGLVESMEEFYIDEDGKKISVENNNLKAAVYAAVCRIKRKGDEKTQEDFFTVDDIKTSGVDVNKYGKKETYLKWLRIMMRYRARTLCLKSKFADLLHGVGIAEYLGHDLPNESISGESVVKIKSRADDITAQLVGGSDVEEQND